MVDKRIPCMKNTHESTIQIGILSDVHCAEKIRYNQ